MLRLDNQKQIGQKLKNLFCIITLLIHNNAYADHASTKLETGSAGAIMTQSGSTLPKGKLVIGFGFQFLGLDEIPDARLEQLGVANEDVHSTASLLNLTGIVAYGITDNFTVGLSLPYVERTDVREAHNDMGIGEAELAGDSKGLGDMTLFGQYRFFNRNKSHAALLAGVKTPTGDTDELELEGARFETEQQPGSGSWDPFIGLAIDKSWGIIGLSGNILYTIATKGTQDTDLGDTFNYNIALSYRAFSPEGSHDHSSHVHGLNIIDYVDLVIELNGDSKEKAVIASHKEEHTGGQTLYLSPGMRIGAKHSWSVFASVGVPINNNINSEQSEPDYRIIGGISKAF